MSGYPRKRGSLAERFSRYLNEPDANGCILWTSCINKRGYGQFGSLRAHRAAWEIKNGPIPDGLCVLHKCDVRNCVNVEHLFLGTPADNTRDAMQKGRLNPWPVKPDNRGSRNGQAKLNEENVAAIRRALERGVTRREISEFYRISRAVVDGIAWRTLWKHVA